MGCYLGIEMRCWAWNFRVLEQMLCDIATLQDDTPLTRFWTFVKDPSKIADMRKQYDDALGLFHVRTHLTDLTMCPEPQNSWALQ
jgi:hypothetical protein